MILNQSIDAALTVAIADIKEKYSESETHKYDSLYEDFRPIDEVLSLFHDLLNKHFVSINQQSKGNHYYWAEPSRELITLRDDIHEFLGFLRKSSHAVELKKGYALALDVSEDWLSWSSGSTIPDDYAPVSIERYTPIFEKTGDTSISLKNSSTRVDLRSRGSGSFADVYSYKDPNYGIKFALKRGKKTLDERERERFKREFDLMKQIKSPYVLRVYKYDEKTLSYTMEYCDYTLHDYILDYKGNNLEFGYRKRIAQQFLYGVIAIHAHRIWHRDFSLWNILIQEFDSNVVQVKISDFGLSRTIDSTFTQSKSQVKGTFADPALDHFNAYKLEHEIYAIGRVLHFIFTGKTSTSVDSKTLRPIIQKCLHPEIEKRYQSVRDLLREIDQLQNL